jgi:hypothetical protein
MIYPTGSTTCVENVCGSFTDPNDCNNAQGHDNYPNGIINIIL